MYKSLHFDSFPPIGQCQAISLYAGRAHKAHRPPALSRRRHGASSVPLRVLWFWQLIIWQLLSFASAVGTLAQRWRFRGFRIWRKSSETDAVCIFARVENKNQDDLGRDLNNYLNHTCFTPMIYIKLFWREIILKLFFIIYRLFIILPFLWAFVLYLSNH